MRILTVRHPWSHAIVWAGKDVENRTRNVAGGYRGIIAIHAAARVNPISEWDDFAKLHPQAARVLRDAPSGIETFGAIIGVVDLIDVHYADECVKLPPPGVPLTASGFCSAWAEPRAHHLVLANPRPLAEPIPYRGALGLRNLAVNDPQTTAQILAQIGHTE